MLILTALGALGGLTVVLALLLIIAYKKLQVKEDPRIDIVEEMLPHANCGACGYPGCRPFAEALVREEALPGKCTVSSDEGRQQIAAFLGVDVGASEKQVARLACGGGINVARNRARYQGLQSCEAASLVSGGGKECFWGCLGLGDCVDACDFDAIKLNAFHLPVINEDKCTACGDCVVACPKDLLSLHPVSHRLWINCKNLEAGDEILEECKVACTACGRCAMDAPDQMIVMKENLPVIDYRNYQDTTKPMERCPTGAIVYLHPQKGKITGPKARPVIRTSARTDAPT